MQGVEGNGSGEGRGALYAAEGEQKNETSVVTLSQSHNNKIYSLLLSTVL
jgi:hypothetical protein